MKLFFIVSMLFSFSYSNFNMHSIQGLGENKILNDPALIGLGDSWYFSGQTNGVSIKSSATYWRTRLTQISSSFAFVNSKFDNSFLQNNQMLSYIHFQFPIGKNKSLGFSLSPDTRVKYHVFDKGMNEENILFNGDIINTDYIYFAEGGITNLIVSYSMSILKDYSLGLTWNVGFGTLLKRDSIITNTIEAIDFNEFFYNNQYIDTEESRYTFKSNSFNINGIYTRNNFEISTSFIVDYNLVYKNGYYFGKRFAQ